MINKKFAAVVLAVGLFVSIGYAVSQQRMVLPEMFNRSIDLTSPTVIAPIADEGNKATAYTTSPIKSYYVSQQTLTASEEATIVCVLINGERIAVKFLKDDAPIQQNFLSETDWSYLYYPYSRYNDVLALLETGNAEFGRDTGEGARPESAAIRMVPKSG
jgi:hypothetical protein